MSQWDRMGRIGQGLSALVGQSEPESHSEHQEALDATLFRASGISDELVFELVAGELRVRQT